MAAKVFSLLAKSQLATSQSEPAAITFPHNEPGEAQEWCFSNTGNGYLKAHYAQDGASCA